MIYRISVTSICKNFYIDVDIVIGVEFFKLSQYLIKASQSHHNLLPFVLETVVHKFTLKREVTLLIETFCLDVTDKIK